MNVRVWTEARFARTPDGKIWTPASNDYGFWCRYLAAFEAVRVVARLQDIDQADATWTRVDGPSVDIIPIPHYRGLSGLIATAWRVRRASEAAAASAEDAKILRVPSALSLPATRWLRRNGHPYALEVVGDPASVFSASASDIALRAPIRLLATRAMTRQVANADAVSYVTQRALQTRYPARRAAVTAAYSSISLSAGAYVPAPRDYAGGIGSPLTICSIASLEQPYKGIDILIDALSILRATGVPARLTVIGDGRLRESLEAHADAAGVGGLVEFTGSIQDRDVINQKLDESDLFVLASRAEGLPRALIEAMARGLPCIATDVGGIGELLSGDQMVPSGDATALADQIARRADDHSLLAQESARNLDVAHRYAETVLADRRGDFYRAVASLTDSQP